MAESLKDYSLSRQIKQGSDGGLKKVGVIGCGSMGQEIVTIISQHGIDVVFIDLSDERISSIYQNIELQLDEVIGKWGLTHAEKRAIMSRIHGSTDYNDMKDCN